MTTAWRWLRRQLRAHNAPLRFCLRLTAAALIAFALMQFWTLPLRGLWAVLTAVVVIQSSIGGSLRVTTEYVIGTLAGAVYASAVGLLFPHTTTLELMGVLALAVAPLAFLAARSPSFRVAPFTAIIVLLLSGQFGESPVASALTRLGEVVLGGGVAVFVSLLVLPDRAHVFGIDAAKRALNQLADALPRVLAGLARPIEENTMQVLQDGVGRAVSAFETTIGEVERERQIGLPLRPDPGPMSRTLLRLRHDLVILGRAAATPLSDAFAQRLEPFLSAVATAGQQELRSCAGALTSRQALPDVTRFEAAIDAYVAEVAGMRRAGLTLPLAENEAEQLLAVGFALDQMRRNFRDLLRVIKEWSQEFAR